MSRRPTFDGDGHRAGPATRITSRQLVRSLAHHVVNAVDEVEVEAFAFVVGILAVDVPLVLRLVGVGRVECALEVQGGGRVKIQGRVVQR